MALFNEIIRLLAALYNRTAAKSLFRRLFLYLGMQYELVGLMPLNVCILIL